MSEEKREGSGIARRGLCRLTGLEGQFVRSHILPEALTRHDTKGEAIYQIGGTRRPSRRRTSWYDPNLVVLTGERILTEYDTWGIRRLRAHGLVWGGWQGSTLAEQVAEIGADGFGIRLIPDDDWLRLRLFFLSLLWRAAASDMPEFSEIELSEYELERLRRMVLDRDPSPLDFYPIALTQLSTRGPSHNITPLAQEMLVPIGYDIIAAPIFRFYLQGLIIHFHRPSDRPSPYATGLGVGTDDRLLVMARPYNGSWQEENLTLNFAEAYEAWPQIRPKLEGLFVPPEK